MRIQYRKIGRHFASLGLGLSLLTAAIHFVGCGRSDSSDPPIDAASNAPESAAPAVVDAASTSPVATQPVEQTAAADVPANRPAAKSSETIVEPKYATPEACFAAFQTARESDDYATLLGSLTEFSRLHVLGEMAFQLEQHVLFGRPGAADGAKLRERYGLSGVDIMGHMQVLSSTRRDPGAALSQGGAWVVEPVAFMTAANKLFKSAPQRAIDEIEAELTTVPEYYARRRKAAASDAERSELTEEEQVHLTSLRESLAEWQMALEAAKNTPPPAKSNLANLEETGDTATAMLEINSEPQGRVYFQKIEGGWRMTLRSPEPEVALPTEDDRRLARLQTLGSLERSFGNDEGAFWTFDSHLRGAAFTDEDLAFVVSFPQLRGLRIHGSEQITDRGLASLAARPELTTVRLSDLHVTSAGVAELAKLQRLVHLELINLDIDDAAVASLRRALPKCQIDEQYSLHGPILDGRFADSRDIDRLAVHIVCQGALPLSKITTPEEDPAVKQMVRLVRQSRAQLLTETIYYHQGPYDWTKDCPWFKSQELPQFAFFLPGEEQPALVVGDVSVKEFTAALQEVLKKQTAPGIEK